MSKDTARQEVEKVCFAYEKAGKTGNKKDWGKFYDLEEPLIKKVEVANQPKLSIPKKIAEMLDGVSIEAKNYVKANHFDSYSVLDDFTELREFYEADEDEIFPGFMGLKEYINNNLSICVAYLACKALGVELVEVEG